MTQQSQKVTAKRQTAAVMAAAKTMTTKQQKQQGTAAEIRHHLIAETAYHIAEQRGFQGDMAMADWLQAEAEVDARFAASH